MKHAREFLRTALIKVLCIPNVRNETNKYFERYIDVIPENKTYTDSSIETAKRTRPGDRRGPRKLAGHGPFYI